MDALGGTPPTQRLRDVATEFVWLQEQRHRADYDAGATVGVASAQAVVDRARALFTNWHAVRGTQEANVFLVALLVYENLEKV